VGDGGAEPEQYKGEAGRDDDTGDFGVPALNEMERLPEALLLGVAGTWYGGVVSLSGEGCGGILQRISSNPSPTSIFSGSCGVMDEEEGVLVIVPGVEDALLLREPMERNAFNRRPPELDDALSVDGEGGWELEAPLSLPKNPLEGLRFPSTPLLLRLSVRGLVPSVLLAPTVL
jgi:hypothetical protein